MSSSKRILIVAALIGFNLLFTIKELSLASQIPIPEKIDIPTADAAASQGTVLAQTKIPQVSVKTASAVQTKSVKLVRFTATAYSSTPDQTDGDPFITASGQRVHPGVAASNVLPFGTKFKLPALFGDQIFTIEDRMNAKYDGQRRVDIWFNSTEKAIDFGVKNAEMEIL